VQELRTGNRIHGRDYEKMYDRERKETQRGGSLDLGGITNSRKKGRANPTCKVASQLREGNLFKGRKVD